MPLKPCRECGEQVSTEAESCPKCGIKKPIANKKKSFFWIGILGFFVLVGLLGGHDKTGSGIAASGDSAAPEICNYSDTQKNAAIAIVRSEGYDCASEYSMCRYAFSNGFTLACNGSGGELYNYEFENHGGKWSVKAD